MLQFDEEVIAWTCNSIQKISEISKNIKESDDSLLRNYWIYIYIYIYMTKQ